MAEEGVYMDIDGVQNIASTFRQMGDVMDAVSKGLEIAIDILRTAAFFGLVGTAAIAQYLDGIKPHVDTLASKFQELNLDVVGAVVSYRDGDVSGSKRFQ
jgi:hypothetical protein